MIPIVVITCKLIDKTNIFLAKISIVCHIYILIVFSLLRPNKMEQTCRVCMSNSVTLVDIFTKPHPTKKEPSLVHMLNACIECEVKPDDPFPKKICLTCVIEAKNAFKFKTKCERSHNLFCEMLSEEKAISEILEPETPILESEIDLGCVKIEKTDPSDQHYDHNDTQADEQTIKSESSTLPIGSEVIAKGFTIRSISPVIPLVQSPNYCLFKCPHCSKIFKERPLLQAHLRIHKGEDLRIFQCQLCTDSFKKYENLQLHLRIHSVQRSFICRRCSKAFHHPSSLERHLRTHEPLKCPDCAKSFTRRQDLTYHMLVHTGQRPYSCPHCCKAFKKKQHLDYHILTHTRMGLNISS